MVGINDLDSYREKNDISPDDPAPREPQGEPSQSTEHFWIWGFEAEASETVPDVFVVAKDPEPLNFRMWVFAGNGANSHFIMRASHKYGEDEVVANDEDCCEVLMDGQSLRERHCPPEVENIVSELAAADVIMPKVPDDDDSRGPVSY